MKHNPILTPVLGLALLIGAGFLAGRVDPGDYTGGRSRDEEDRVRRNSSALAAMLGEFRTSFSDIMFIKTERYLHAGVGYAPHHDESALDAEALVADIAEHQSELGIPGAEEEEHSGFPTLIPSANRDFRGWIGTLHRQVKPWRDPSKAHIHTDGRELLPWFRLMTSTDPRYVRGYVAGGFWLQHVDRDIAMKFIDEGLINNPTAFQLYVSRGFLRIAQARHAGLPVAADHPAEELRSTLQAARNDFLQGAELGLAQRPPDVDEDGYGSGDWAAYQDNDVFAACRMAVLLTGRLGDPEQAGALRRRFEEALGTGF